MITFWGFSRQENHSWLFSVKHLQLISKNIFTAQKSFPLQISSVNVTKSAVSCDLIIFTEEILNGKLHFLCSDNWETSRYENCKIMRKTQITLVSLFGLCFRIIVPKMLTFKVPLPLKTSLMVTYNETLAFTAKEYVVEQGMNILKAWEKHKLLWPYPSSFCFGEIASKLVSFPDFYLCNNPWWLLSMKHPHSLVQNV